MYIYTCRIIGNNIISVGALDSQLVQESKNATSESLAHRYQIATARYISRFPHGGTPQLSSI